MEGLNEEEKKLYIVQALLGNKKINSCKTI